MNIKKIVKTNSLFLSAILIAETIIPGAYASKESPSILDLCPPLLTNSGANSNNTSALRKLQKTAAKRHRREELEQKSEKAMKKLKKRCLSKGEKSSQSPTHPEEQEPAFSFRFNSFAPLVPPVPQAVPMSYAYPAEPPTNLPEAQPTERDNAQSKGVAPSYISEEFLKEPQDVCPDCYCRCDDAPIDPHVPLNILPRFSPDDSGKPSFPTSDTIGRPSDCRRRSRREMVSRRFRELPEKDECRDSAEAPYGHQHENLLDIIFLPEPQPFCVRFPMGKPILVINVNKNFKDQISEEEFDTKAEYELKRWLESCRPCQEAAIVDRLKNVEMILCHTKVFKIMRRVFGAEDWSTTFCRPLCVNSRFNGLYLDRENLMISHRSGRTSPNHYNTDSLFGILLYLVEFPEFMRMSDILPHPLFKDKELIADIDKISALCSSDCPDEYVINRFLETCILRKVTNDRYCDHTLSKMQDCFKSAAVLREKDSLMHAIGYFNLARTLNSLSFTRKRIRVKDDLLDCLDS